MEITASNIYWITRLDALEGLFILLAAAGVLVSLIAAFVAIAAEKDEEIQGMAKRALKFSIPVLLVGSLGIALVPTTKEAAAMWVVPKVANGEAIPAIGTNVLHLIDVSLNNLKDR